MADAAEDEPGGDEDLDGGGGIPAGVAQRYPFDFDVINKGDTISAADCQVILGGDPETSKYQLKLLELSKEVERELWSRGKRYVVRIRQSGLAVLTDPEAAEYTAVRFDGLERGLTRTHTKAIAVEVINLSKDQRRAHDRAVAVQGMTLAAIAATHRAVEPLPYRRPHAILPGE